MNNFNVFLIGLDVILMALAGYYLHWQSKIQVASRYAVTQLMWAVFLGFWFMTTRVDNLPYIVFISIFLVLSIMAGTGGLAPTRLIANGILARVIPYANMSSITLTPVSLPNGQEWVVAVFALSKRRMVRLTFQASLQNFMTELTKVLPKTVPVTVQRMN
ncbi:hypothetical protein [Lacticaseibacillus paracasei]|uniref:hypothetical protein n=1 Tax=Lacticaseibacillus paracasei TaxID=1597 RepID=UPI0030921DFF|nr:hypothetical protein SGY26_11690 [Lacticaseibacillus paracasei]WQG46170.1 hypothetical protein U2Q69_08340 [Lacticaseibacillus casei]